MHTFKKSKVAYQKYIKRETAIVYLNPKVVIQKIEGADPLWMKEQLDEDFAPFENRTITVANVDETFDTIQKNYPGRYWIRYRIIDKKLYRFFPEDEPISTSDNDVERAFKAIIHLTALNNIDLIVGFEDGMLIGSMPEGFYLTEDPKNQAPLFISAKRKGTPFAILVPDWRSISWWWARDIQDVEQRSMQTPWHQKINRGVWRGSLTRNIRLKLCEIAKEHPEILDAKLSIQVDDQQLQTYLEKNGMFGGRVEWDDFLKHKFLPILDGVMCAAPALQWRLLSKCLTLKQESDEIQWFYKGIHPYQHYVPVKSDLSDCIQQMEWAKLHDQECEAIAQRAYAFAKENLMMEDVYHYFIRVLERYSKIQVVNAAEVKTNMARDPRWVCIHDRSALKNQLMSDSHRLVIHAPTPY